MYAETLRALIETGVSRIEQGLTEVPQLATGVTGWMEGLSGTHNPADYFLHPIAFPMFLLPWWVAESLGNEPDLALQADLAYSTANGYYHTRLIDDLMDGDAETDVRLLPALNLFHLGFQMPYHRYFAADHPFWSVFQENLLNAAEFAYYDAQLNNLTLTHFRQIAGQKCCAANIPVAAVCYRADRPELLADWSQFIADLSCWHQMMNDLLGWHKDDRHGNATYFLSEGERRKRTDEPLSLWVMREGFGWGCDLVQRWMTDLQRQAEGLNSPGLITYLSHRDQLFRERADEVQVSFNELNQLMTVIEA